MFSRPITATKDQDVSVGSTLVTFLLNSDRPSAVVSALLSSSGDLNTFLKSVSTSTTYDEAYELIESSSQLQQQFSNLFGTTPDVLATSSPEVTRISIPAMALESFAVSLNVETSHWSTSYTSIYEWKIDGQILGLSPGLTWVPTENSQWSHTVSVRIGSDNGSGQLDMSKPVRELLGQITVANNVLPTAPMISLSSPVIIGSEPINTTELILT